MALFHLVQTLFFLSMALFRFKNFSRKTTLMNLAAHGALNIVEKKLITQLD
jgi:hypothetical protein